MRASYIKERDQRAVAQPARLTPHRCVDQLPGFVAVEDGCPAFFDDVLGTAHRSRWVLLDHLATISQSNSMRIAAKVLLDRRRLTSPRRPG
jgi:hypothetical protein